MFLFFSLIWATTIQPFPWNPEKTPEEWSQYNYLWVGGFMNEFLPHYFQQNIAYLLETGVPADQIHVYLPDSNKSLKVNALGLKRFFSKLPQDRPWKIIAHSKGAFEAYLFYLNNPEFHKHIKSLDLIQGAFGTPLADYVNGKGPEIDSRLNWFQKLQCRFAEGLRLLIGYKIDTSISQLETKTARKIIEEVTHSSELGRDSLAKIRFHISSQNAQDQTKLFYCSGAYLETYFSANDGLILTEDQFIRLPYTRVYALEEIDHMDLVLGTSLSKRPYSFRKKFTASILNL